MSNMKDFHKISGGTYGAVNFNKMIPVSNFSLILIDIEKESDENYKNLLRNQYRALLAMSDVILRKSENIYKLFITDNENLSEYDKKVKSRCCNFLLLEKKMHEYKAIIPESKAFFADLEEKIERFRNE